MTITNPRRYSFPHAVVIGVLTLVAFFVSICFDLGNGSFGAGVKSALNYLLFPFHGIGLLLASAVVAWLAVLAGRWMGTTLTAIIAGGLLGVFVIDSYATSQPLARFKRLVWAGAPDSLQGLNHEAYHSFNDGTVYLFSISASPDMIERLCDATGLEKIRPSPEELKFGLFPAGARRLRGISKLPFPADVEFHTHPRNSIELAYMPSKQEALVVCFPRRD